MEVPEPIPCSLEYGMPCTDAQPLSISQIAQLHAMRTPVKVSTRPAIIKRIIKLGGECRALSLH